ncbi:MAG: hypothetical protein ACI4I6_00330 [Hominimerdicola sp.]
MNEVLCELELIKKRTQFAENKNDFQRRINSIPSPDGTILDKLKKFALEHDFISFDRLVNGLTNNASEIKILLNITNESNLTTIKNDNKEKNIQNKINKICSNWLPVKEKTWVNPKIPNENIKQIILDYAFIKQIRNTLNHASDVEEKNLEYFKREGTPSIDERYLTINIGNIKRFVINALDYIEKFLYFSP